MGELEGPGLNGCYRLFYCISDPLEKPLIPGQCHAVGPDTGSHSVPVIMQSLSATHNDSY